MKVTIELPDSLVREAERLAAERGTSLRALVEQGLRQVVDRQRRAGDFVLRDASVGGRGMRPEWQDAGWDRLREEVHRGASG
jgi:predicted transcriptional regulator